jgi:3-phenylpropionate/trans-cinnamate dioxygenase ferredoxin component
MYNYVMYSADQLDYVQIAAESDLPVGERLFVEIDRQPIVVFNLAGQYFAIADLCSHDDGPVGDGDIEGMEVICPRHGARFDLRDGKATSLPAVLDIPAYPVRVMDGQIEVGVLK